MQSCIVGDIVKLMFQYTSVRGEIQNPEQLNCIEFLSNNSSAYDVKNKIAYLKDFSKTFQSKEERCFPF